MPRSLRRLSFALQTALNIRKLGYFIPYRYASAVPDLGTVPDYPAIADMFAASLADMERTLARVEALAPKLQAIGHDDRPPEPRWGQSWFPRLDAAVAYTIMATVQPARLIEVGSGHSTRFFARAARDAGFGPEIVAIDPAPRADIARLGVRTRRTTVQETDPDFFRALNAGDILSIDSSHILMPGSDVDYLLHRVLPLLPGGVHVHIHDIFLPGDYPLSWAWRAYNEQQGVASLLLGGRFNPLWSSQYMNAHAKQRIEAGPVGRVKRHEDSPESSLWLLKTG